MITGWTRVCPDCGNRDGAKVERIAFHPTFRCRCGYVWDGSRATFVGVWKVDARTAGADVDALADQIAERMLRRQRENPNRLIVRAVGTV